MSADPWTHEWLKARVREHVTAWAGREVVVHRFHQRPARGELLRGDEGRGAVIIAGVGAIPVDQIERVEAA